MHTSTIADIKIADSRLRIDSLGRMIDHSLRVAGYYKRHYHWVRRGVITMRGLGHMNDISHAIKRESARRHMDALAPAERDAEIDRHIVSLPKLVINDI